MASPRVGEHVLWIDPTFGDGWPKEPHQSTLHDILPSGAFLVEGVGGQAIIVNKVWADFSDYYMEKSWEEDMK